VFVTPRLGQEDKKKRLASREKAKKRPQAETNNQCSARDPEEQPTRQMKGGVSKRFEKEESKTRKQLGVYSATWKQKQSLPQGENSADLRGSPPPLPARRDIGRSRVADLRDDVVKGKKGKG